MFPFGRKIVGTALLGLTSAAAWAGNGMNVIGSGATSIAMGGADVASVTDTAALAINPAALSAIEHSALDLYVSPFYALNSHRDALGNDDKTDAPLNATLGGGYARRLSEAPQWVLGVGSFVQGGTGFSYPGLQTPYGTRDELSALFAVVKLVFGASRQINEQLSLGAALGISYASARQKQFPDTSAAGEMFFGSRLDGTEDYGATLSIGALYRPTPKLRLGFNYTTENELALHGGSLTLNLESVGLGRVRYENARFDGLVVPQELSVGMAYELTPTLLLAADFKWLDWSAIKTSRLRADSPSNPEAAPTIDASSPMNWRDQHVFAVGLAYALNDATTLRGGINYASRQPIPGESLSATMNLVEHYELDIGFGHKLENGWAIDAALQIIPAQTKSYTNPSSPPMGAAKETFEAYILTASIGRRW